MNSEATGREGGEEEEDEEVKADSEGCSDLEKLPTSVSVTVTLSLSLPDK